MNIVGKVMLINNLIKVNMGNKTKVVYQVSSEAERLAALGGYFGIRLMEEDANSICGWDMALDDSS